MAPTATWQFYSSLLWDPARTGGVAYIGNQSLRGVWERLSATHAVAFWAGSALVVLAVAAWGVRRHRGDPWFALTIAAVAGLLVSPISWTHHWVWVLPVVAVAIRHRHDRRALLAASALFLLPCLAQTVLWSRPVAPTWSVDMYALAGLDWVGVASLATPWSEPTPTALSAVTSIAAPPGSRAVGHLPDQLTTPGPAIEP